MKKRYRLLPLFCLMVVFLCSGCETVKGAWRDAKNMDQWMRDTWW